MVFTTMTTTVTTATDTTAMDTTAMGTTAMDTTIMDIRGMNAIQIISAREEPNVAKILDSNSVQILCTVVNFILYFSKQSKIKLILKSTSNLDQICEF